MVSLGFEEAIFTMSCFFTLKTANWSPASNHGPGVFTVDALKPLGKQAYAWDTGPHALEEFCS